MMTASVALSVASLRRRDTSGVGANAEVPRVRETTRLTRSRLHAVQQGQFNFAEGDALSKI